MKPKHSLPPLAAVLLLSFVADAGAALPTELDPMVVTATADERRRTDTAADVVVIGRAEIEASMAVDVVELLQRVAGLDISRSGGPGRQASIFLRGGNSDHTLVLVDGVPINEGTTGAAAIQMIDPDSVERIEILKGPRASLYGNSAVSGVIQIFTRRAGDSGVELGARVGSHESRDLRVGARWADPRLGAVSLTASSQSVGAFKPKSGNPTETEYDQDTVGINGSRPLGDGSVRASLWSANAQVEYLDFFGNPLDQDQTHRSARIGVDQAIGDRWELQFDLTESLDSIEQRQGNDFARTHAWSLRQRSRLAISEDQALTVDLSWTARELRALSFGTSVDEDREFLTTGLGWRLDTDLLLLQAQVSHEDRDEFDVPVLWNLDAGLRLGGGVTLLALAGTGFNAPTVFDRFGFGANPDLEPERSRSLETGVRWVPAESLVLELRAFENTTRDLHTFVGVFPATRVENVERARTRGAELSARWQQGSWSLDAAAASQDPENLSNGSRLLRRARESGSLALAWSPSRGSLRAELVARGDRPDVGGQRLGGYALLNLSGTLALDEHWSLQARINNALDKDHTTVAGFNESGLAGWLGMSWSVR